VPGDGLSISVCGGGGSWVTTTVRVVVVVTGSVVTTVARWWEAQPAKRRLPDRASGKMPNVIFFIMFIYSTGTASHGFTVLVMVSKYIVDECED
jgi:hypothetical protein